MDIDMILKCKNVIMHGERQMFFFCNYIFIEKQAICIYLSIHTAQSYFSAWENVKLSQSAGVKRVR